jgi:hypothetical protein
MSVFIGTDELGSGVGSFDKLVELTNVEGLGVDVGLQLDIVMAQSTQDPTCTQRMRAQRAAVPCSSAEGSRQEP